MASRGVSSRLQPPQEYDEEEEEENESDTYSEDDPSSTSSDADTEPEVAVNLPQTLGQARDSAIEVDEETEDEEVNEEEIRERVENGEEKGKGDVGIELGDNSVLPSCPVCMEPWTSEGPHRVCCIPCGHVYGRLCLEKWLLKCMNKGKCPQCNAKFNPKQIINLYAPRIVVPNDDLEKEVKFLRENIKSLILEKTRLLDVIDKRLPRVEFMFTQTYFYNLSQGMPFQYPPHGLFDIDFYERAGHAPPPPPYPHPYQPPPPLENQDE